MKHRLSITGMKCTSCVAGIESALKAVPGVKSANVNFATKTAEIDGDVEVKPLLGAIASQGYQSVVLNRFVEAEQEGQERRHYLLLLKKSLFAAIVGIPLFIDALWPWLPALSMKSVQWPWVVVGVISFLVLYFSGGHIYRSAWQSLLHRHANMNTLVAMGTGVAWAYSMVIVLIPQRAHTQ